MPRTATFQSCSNGTPVSDGSNDDAVVRTVTSNQTLFIANGSNVRSTIAVARDTVRINAASLMCSNVFGGVSTWSSNIASASIASNASASNANVTYGIIQNLATDFAAVTTLTTSNAFGSNVTFCNLAASNAALVSSTVSILAAESAHVQQASISNVYASNINAGIVATDTVMADSGLTISASNSAGVIVRPATQTLTVPSGNLTVAAPLVTAGGVIAQSIGINTSNPAFPLDVQGAVYATSVISPLMSAPSIVGGRWTLCNTGYVQSSASNVHISSSNASGNILIGTGGATAMTVRYDAVAFDVPVITSDVRTSNVTVGGTVTACNANGAFAISTGSFVVANGSNVFRVSTPATSVSNVSVWSQGTGMEFGPPGSPGLIIGTDGTLTLGTSFSMASGNPLRFGPHNVTGTVSALSLDVAGSNASHLFSQSGSERARISTNASARGGCIQFPNVNSGARCVLWQDGADVSAYGGLGKESGTVVLRTPPAQDIVFVGGNGTNGTEYARIQSSGRFGVNVTPALGRFHVSSAADERVLLVENTGATTSVNSCIVVRQATAGSFTTAAIEFQVNGVVTGSIAHPTVNSTTYNTISDYRLKKVVGPIRDAAHIIDNLRPIQFQFRDDVANGIYGGFLAHEVQEHLPEAVTGPKDGPQWQQMDVSKLIPYMLANMQDLNRRIRELEAASSN